MVAWPHLENVKERRRNKRTGKSGIFDLI